MRNPFLELGKPRVEEGEEVGGSFSCQTKGCHSVVHEGRYVEEIQLLSWICGEGHTNKIEGFRING